jgi:translocation and assembly module TamB
MKKWLLGIGIFVSAFFVLILLISYGLLASERGSRWLLQTAIHQSAQKFEVSGMTGTLLSPLSIEKFSYDSCAVNVSIKNLQLHWQPSQILDKTLTIQKLIADAIIVKHHPECQESSQEIFTLPESISTPLAIKLDLLSVDQFLFQQSNRSPISIENILLNAKSHKNKITLQLESLDYTTFNMQTKMTVELRQPYPVNGDVQWRYLQNKKPYQGELNVDGNIHSLALTHKLQTPYVIDTKLTANNPINDLNFTSTSQWQSITTEIEEQQKFVLRNGTLKASGTVSEIHYEVDTLIDTSQASNIALSSKGLATTQSVTLIPLKLQHGNTQLTATGKIGFANQLEVLIDVLGKDINPALLYADYPGKLQLDTKIAFTQNNQRNQLQMDIRKLHGKLRNYPVQGSGQIQSDLEKIQLENIYLTVGDNQIEVNGLIAKSIDLHAKINASQIRQLFANATGDVQGTIHLRGTRENPIADLALTSNLIHYQDLIEIRNAELSAHVKDDAAQVIDASVKLEEITLENQTLQDLSLDLNGTIQRHTLNASLETEYGMVSMSAMGTFQQEMKLWQGSLEQLVVKHTQFGDWKSKNATQIIASSSNQSIEPLCMQRESQSICIDYINNTSQGKILNAQIKKIELANIQSYLPDYGQIQGLLEGTATLVTDDQNQWTGTINLNTYKLALTPTDESDFDETLTFEKMELDLQLNKYSNVQLAFNSNYGTGLAKLGITSLSTIQDAIIEQGMIQLNLPDLLFLNPHLNQAVIKKGQAQLDIQISGPLQKPHLKGQGKIEALDFYLPKLGTEYQNVQFSIDANDFSKMDIEGKLDTTKGYLNVKGQISLENLKNIAYQFSIVGENFPVIDTVDVVASITPNLMIEGNTQRVEINGALLIPKLHIILKKLPEELDVVSDDEIIVTENNEFIEQKKIATVGNIDLSLGNEVTFTGYGLQTELIGGLKITLQEQQPVVGHGVFVMENAQYIKFGQSLDINKGNIIFSGPLEDPSLDIQIQRSTSDVTVTMFISGKARDPQTKLSSDPSLSEANKLSYLLTGRSVNNLSDGEGSNLTSAALALGLSQSSSAIQEIGTKFGLDTLSVDTGENGLQSTSLLLGKHLSPRLYITYAKDLFSALGAVQINYRLTDHISLEVESGSRQTVDLIYSINKE